MCEDMHCGNVAEDSFSGKAPDAPLAIPGVQLSKSDAQLMNSTPPLIIPSLPLSNSSLQLMNSTPPLTNSSL